MTRIWKEPNTRNLNHASLWTYYVYVCSFTFHFYSSAEIREYLDYFNEKIHSTGRIYQVGLGGNGDHGDCQSCFQRLPLYLSEEPKRQKVIKALQKALAEFDFSR